MEPDQLGRLRDIYEAARLITTYIAGTSETDFRGDTEKQDAIIRRIEIMGEAAAHLSRETRESMPQLPLRKIRGMRNIVAHQYGKVDLRIVWEVATIHIPEICTVLEPVFGKKG